MAEQDVFSETTTNNPDSPLDELVGEAKKFKTVEDLAKGKLEADAFIEQLKLEKQQVMEELERTKGEEKKQETVSALLEEIRNAKNKDDSVKDPLSENDLDERVKQILQGESAKQTAERNREQGNKLVLEKFNGDVEAAKSFIAERARDLGTTPKQLAELSESSPKLFAKALDVNPSTTGTNTSALQGVNTGSLGEGTQYEIDGTYTKAYFDKLRKEMGPNKWLNDRALQKQYLAAGMKLGDRF